MAQTVEQEWPIEALIQNWVSRQFVLERQFRFNQLSFAKRMRLKARGYGV